MCLADFPAETDANTSDFAIGTVHTAEDIALPIRSKAPRKVPRRKARGNEDSSSSPSLSGCSAGSPAATTTVPLQQAFRRAAHPPGVRAGSDRCLRDLSSSRTSSTRQPPSSQQEARQLEQPQTCQSGSTVTKEAKRPDCTGCHCQYHGEEMPTRPRTRMQDSGEAPALRRQWDPASRADSVPRLPLALALALVRRERRLLRASSKDKKIKMDDDSLLETPAKRWDRPARNGLQP